MQGFWQLFFTPPRKRIAGRGSPDMPFLLLVLILLVFGAVMSFSASAVYAEQFYDDSAYFFKRYILFALLAIVVSIPFIWMAKPAFWRLFAVFLYGFSVFLLLLVLLVGTVGGGAQRWLVLGPITVQPSEIAKLALILCIALDKKFEELFYF